MKTLLPVFAALLLASCTTPPASIEHHELYVKPAMVMLTADQAAARGLKVESAPAADPTFPADLQPTDTRSVIAPPGVKVYTLSRATDPADRDILHEQHVIYRRETTPAWRLQAPTDQKILIGPRVTDGRDDLQPVLSKELVSFIAEERRATEANQKAIAALFQAVERLNSSVGRAPTENEATSPGRDGTPPAVEPNEKQKE